MTMSLVLKVLGILLVIVGVAIPTWLFAARTGKTNHPSWGMGSGILAVFAGLALILEDRITELTMRGVGTIHAVTDQAIVDAKTVADLKDRVTNQSATVDLVASEAAKAKETSELAAAQTKQAGQTLETLNTAIKEGQDALRSIKEVEDFQTLVLAAQNDDRNSFDKLHSIAVDKENRFSTLAENAWMTIFESHSGPMSQSGFKLPWDPKVDPSKLSLEDLSKLYKSIPPTLKPALLEYIWSREDIKKVLRLDFMMDVMKTDLSLTAAEYAGRHFTQGTGQQIKPMALDMLAQWWTEHRQEYVDK